MSATPNLDRIFGAGKEEGEQRSITWLQQRVGKCTASRFKDVLDRLKRSGEPGAKRLAYLWEIVIETITGEAAQHYESAAMIHGSSYEDMGRMAYEARTGAMVLPSCLAVGIRELFNSDCLIQHDDSPAGRTVRHCPTNLNLSGSFFQP